MRGIPRLVVYGAVTGLLAVGAMSATLEVAHAQTQIGQCTGEPQTTAGDSYVCTISETIPSTSGISVTVTDASASEQVSVNVTTLSCTYNTDTLTEPASGETTGTPLTYNIPQLPLTAQTGTCDVVVTMSLPSADPQPLSDYVATLDYTPIAVATPTPTPTTTTSSVHPVKGYGGKCLDDKGNSSANGAAAIIWGCSSSDQAQNWSFSSNELKHNGKCLNDKANGGSGSKVILYSCNGGSNEKWSHLANGEFKLQAHNGALCLNDPAYSTKNGTQLIVYSCKGTSNEKWSLP